MKYLNLFLVGLVMILMIPLAGIIQDHEDRLANMNHAESIRKALIDRDFFLAHHISDTNIRVSIIEQQKPKEVIYKIMPPEESSEKKG